MPRKAVPVQEAFEDPQGRFTNYDAYDTAQRFSLPRQSHVDIRNFEPREVRIRLTMLHLNTMTMSALAAASMSDLAGEVIVRRPEQWTAGVVDTISDHNNWRGLTLTLAAGTNTTTSVI